jgi:hypothetical protein
MQGFGGLKLNLGCKELDWCKGDWIYAVASLIGAGKLDLLGKIKAMFAALIRGSGINLV